VKKKSKLSLNRETIRLLDSGLEYAAGGVSLVTCPPTVTCDDSGCPHCTTDPNSLACGTSDIYCGTGSACTVGC
jgi:hypothetical protein